jgi:predicted MPP superfamily phosphohydrolase
MKLHILSDIHLEFAPFVPPKTDADVVILAGDIHIGTKAISWLKETFPNSTVLYILGNHEYYGQTLPKYTGEIKELVQGSNLHVLEKDSFIVDNIVFLGCSLWTDFDLFGNPRVAGYYATQSMTDYRKIRISPSYRKLRSIDTAGIHYSSRHWIAEQLEKYRGAKIIIVSHHAPSTRSLPLGYEEDILSAAYASRLDAFVENSGACLWIHGHVHICQDYIIGSTRVICNPRGYPNEDTTNFAPSFSINF